jgi:hypothetical protein
MQRLGTLLRIVAVVAVVAAGGAVVGRADSLTLSRPSLGAEQVALPTCAAGSVRISVTLRGRSISSITPQLTSCTGAVASDTLYAGVDDTTAASGNGGACTLASTPPPPRCTAVLNPTVPYNIRDNYAVEIFATPAVAGSGATSANRLTLMPESLLLTSCTVTGGQLGGPGTSC